jgi:hypothetical protein
MELAKSRPQGKEQEDQDRAQQQVHLVRVLGANLFFEIDVHVAGHGPIAPESLSGVFHSLSPGE